MQTKLALLESLDFGSSVAEEETKNLQKYFVDTRLWRNLNNDKYDIVLGAKGSGKSALYLSLIAKTEDFATQGIIIVEAENPRGDTVFASLNTATRNDKYENPSKEALIRDDIVVFWKLYFLTVITAKLRSQGFKGQHFRAIKSLFESLGLLPEKLSLNEIFHKVIHFIGQVVSLKFFKPKMVVDPATGSFEVTGEFSLDKYTAKEHKEGYNTLDELLEKLDIDLAAAQQTVWILLDRLDVAFADDKALERRALRALFMVYNSLKRYDQIRCKIFLRDDIMMNIIYDGLPEASHLTPRMTNLVVDKHILFNILIKRLLNNSSLVQHYKADAEACLLDIEKQNQLFSAVFPATLEENGEVLPTFGWIISRISDGNELFTPRELVQLLIQVKEHQIDLLQLGNKIPEGKLFTSNAFKKAIREVSKAKFVHTLLAENPGLMENLKKFRDAPPQVNTEWIRLTLKDNDGKELEDVDRFATRLSELGFLKRVNETQWRIPYLYQYALGIAPEE